LLAELFEQHHAINQLQAFISDNACRIYGITPPPKTVTLVAHPWIVPERYGKVVPFYAGRELHWRIVV
jgi:dihydroorotase